MKKLLLFFIASVYLQSACADPMTICPTNFITIEYDHTAKFSESSVGSSCGSGYVTVMAVQSCIETTTGPCWMYAPGGMPFNDTTGTYEFTAICPLT